MCKHHRISANYSQKTYSKWYKRCLKPWFRVTPKVWDQNVFEIGQKKCYWETPWIDLYHQNEFGDKKKSFEKSFFSISKKFSLKVSPAIFFIWSGGETQISPPRCRGALNQGFKENPWDLRFCRKNHVPIFGSIENIFWESWKNFRTSRSKQNFTADRMRAFLASESHSQTLPVKKVPVMPFR